MVKVEGKKSVDESEAILSVEWLNLPVSVSNWVLEETSNVFERSPFLGIVSWFHSSVDPFSKVTISRFHKRSETAVSFII